VEKLGEIDEKFYSLKSDYLVIGIVIASLLYLISLDNYPVFHIFAELFSSFVAYVVFIVIWKSRDSLSNRYLLFIGISYFFVGTFDLLHALAFKGVGLFPGFDSNPSIQFWVIARYIESISFLIASLFLVQNKNRKVNYSIRNDNSHFAKVTYLTYGVIALYLLISVFYFKNFPTSYIEGLGVTSFKLISEYMIIFILFCSFILLYIKRNRFDREIFFLIAASIFLTIFGELPFIFYSHMDNFPSLVGHLFKVLSFFFMYKAVVETGFDEPFRSLFRELKLREETLTEEASFLSNEKMLIYSILGINKNHFGIKAAMNSSEKIDERYRSIVQNFSGILFELDRDLLPIFMDGAIEEVTGYNKEEFLSGNVKWEQIIEPEDLPGTLRKIDNFISGTNPFLEFEYRIQRKNREIRWVREKIRRISNSSNKRQKLQSSIYDGSIYDITERKTIEEAVKKHDEARLKEIHHRIKNNLQVISSLLDLQAETFSNLEICKVPEVIEAFRDSQNRVISMALIHEELYKSKDMITLDFGSYIQKLTTDLLSSYTVKDQIDLKMDLEQVYLEMDTAIPLGIIVNELISNSLKYAFQPGKKGEISLILHRDESSDNNDQESADSEADRSIGKRYFEYALVVADNGPGIPEEIDIKTADSLGLQLINILVDQIEGHIELNRKDGTEFRISFNSMLNSYY
jgi:PAS domain S-box-containing protein